MAVGTPSPSVPSDPGPASCELQSSVTHPGLLTYRLLAMPKGPRSGAERQAALSAVVGITASRPGCWA